MLEQLLVSAESITNRPCLWTRQLQLQRSSVRPGIQHYLDHTLTPLQRQPETAALTVSSAAGSYKACIYLSLLNGTMSFLCNHHSLWFATSELHAADSCVWV